MTEESVAPAATQPVQAQSPNRYFNVNITEN